MIAVDGRGNPIKDLTAADFVLRDERRPQKIAFLNGRGAEPPPPPKLPAGVYSNLASSEPTTMTVVLLDALNTEVYDQIYAKQQLLKFLQQLNPDDAYAVYMLGLRQLRVVQAMTTDHAQLLAAIGGTKAEINPELGGATYEIDPTNNPNINFVVQQMTDRSVQFVADERARRTARALQLLALHLSRYPGRKNLIWFSGSFPFTLDLDLLQLREPSRSSFREITEAAQALNDSNVAVYPVDARGLMAPAMPNVVGPRGVQPTGLDLGIAEHESMELLAERTGGQAFFNRNDVQKAIREAIDRSSFAYTLGFYPDHTKWDGKFHELKLECVRKGVHLIYRHGYFAFPERPDNAGGADAGLQLAARSGVDARGLGLIVRVVPDAKDTRAVTIYILLNDPDVKLHQEGDKYIGHVDVYIVQRSRTGVLLDANKKALNFHFTPAEYENFEQSAIKITEGGKLNDSADSIVVVARDGATSQVGSVNVPVKSTAPTK